MTHAGDVGTEIAPEVVRLHRILELAAFAGAALDALRAARR